MTDAVNEQAVREEVDRLHIFIAAWIRGDIARDDQVFDDALAAHIDDDFQNIQPDGGVLTRDDILAGLRGAHGVNPQFRITIHNVSLRGCHDDGRLLLATYLERQSAAKNSIPADNDRFSTVLMRRTDAGRLVWLHLHETARAVTAG